MGTEDMRRQARNVFRMRLRAPRCARSRPAAARQDAVNEAIRDWVTNVARVYTASRSAIGPTLSDDGPRVPGLIGREARAAWLERVRALPSVVVACVGGGSNAIGMFSAFLDDREVRLRGVEAGGLGVESGKHAASIGGGRIGVLHGTRSYVLQDEARADPRDAFRFRRP